MWPIVLQQTFLVSPMRKHFDCRSVWKRNTWQLKAFAFHIPFLAGDRLEVMSQWNVRALTFRNFVEMKSWLPWTFQVWSESPKIRVRMSGYSGFKSLGMLKNMRAWIFAWTWLFRVQSQNLKLKVKDSLVQNCQFSSYQMSQNFHISPCTLFSSSARQHKIRNGNLFMP